MKISCKMDSVTGVPLRDVPYGTVVRREFGGDAETVYLVVSPMDGSGLRALVTMGGGTLKSPSPDLAVIPLEAELIITGRADIWPRSMRDYANEWADAHSRVQTYYPPRYLASAMWRDFSSQPPRDVTHCGAYFTSGFGASCICNLPAYHPPGHAQT